jgi:FkbM family methyltransferase
MFARMIGAYQRLMVRRRFYRLNKLLYFLSLRGLGVLNFENEKLSGERHFVRQLSRVLANPIVIDVGAATGAYSGLVRSLIPTAEIHAFEPHPLSYERLKQHAHTNNYSAYNLGLGSAPAEVALYDYKGLEHGSQHASLHRAVIEKLHAGEAQAWRVQLTTLDQFMQTRALSRIHLLKLDTEGNELSVLRGAQQALDLHQIDIIQFEFNEMNLVSRVLFSDYYDVLEGFSFYRMLPDGLVPLGAYAPLLSEIFAFQNIVAIRPGYALPTL